MTDLLAARGQMTVSLAFHILFAVAGMAMPLLMAIAEGRFLVTGEPTYAELSRRWAKGTAILFAVGAVSGTVLSFELGLLWPVFIEKAGPVVGLAFSLEGYAFFLEAIFLGLFLYGEGRLTRVQRFASAVVVAISGVASGVLVMAVNAWMHTPVGFTLLPDGSFGDIDPWAPFRAPAFPTMAAHMAIAAYTSTAFAVLGIHAWRLLHDPDNRFHRRAAELALIVGALAAPLQALTGDLSAKHDAKHQPIKLAAFEGLFETQRRAPLAIGGWPDVEAGQLRGAIEVPGALSVLAFADPDAEVRGLDAFPRAEWPNVPLAHVSFQVMVGCGSALLALAAWGVWLWWRRKGFVDDRRFLTAAVIAAPLGLVAVEAGWIVTEVARQPWIIRGVMKTADAVAPVPGLVVPFVTFTALYGVLGVIVVVLLRAHVFRVPPSAPAVRARASLEGMRP